MPIYNQFKFYVYAYLRNDGTPYYIGKGCGRRAYDIKRHTIKPPKDFSRIKFLHTNLTNNLALMLEEWYIGYYGRKDLGTGILRNMRDGGKRGCNYSIEHKARLSLIQKNSEKCRENIKTLNENKRLNFIIKTPSGSIIEIIGLNNFCIENNLDAAAMFRTAASNNKNIHYKGYQVRYKDNYFPFLKIGYIIQYPTGEKVHIINLTEFCRENNLDCSSMVKVAKGIYKTSKGYRVYYNDIY